MCPFIVIFSYLGSGETQRVTSEGNTRTVSLWFAHGNHFDAVYVVFVERARERDGESERERHIYIY